jgi:hypothetical protein
LEPPQRYNIAGSYVMNSSFTRRSFLKHTALGAAAFSAAPFTGPNILGAETAGNKINCVQIGCGGRAMNHLE